MDSDDFAREILDATGQHSRARAAEVLKEYRPQIVTDVGETITAQVLDHPDFWDFIESCDEDIEPEEAAHRAAVYLRDHPELAPAAAFAAVRGHSGGE